MRQARLRVDAILIAGPTASGKSALALALAERLDGTIVNADSMQVYRDLRVLTARPSAADEALVPHRLYGTIDGADAYSVSRWLGDADTAIDEAHAAGRLPIVVGGTGLYFKALTQGLSAIPAIPAAVREEVRGWAAERTPADLHAMLTACDPTTAARLRPTDPQRIVRALEVHRTTGTSLAAYQAQRQPPILDLAGCAAIVLEPEREMLRERVDRRFDAMMATGALDEVAALGARGFPATQPVMRTLGVPPLLRYLADEIDLVTAVERAKINSRQYLKRQDTFARHQLAGFRPVAPDRAEEALLDQFA